MPSSSSKLVAELLAVPEVVALEKERDMAIDVAARAERERDRLAADALTALAGAGIPTPVEGYSGAPWALGGDIRRLAADRDHALELAARAGEALATAHRRAADFEAALADAKAVQACTDAWLDAALEELAQVRVRAAELQTARDEARDAHMVMTRRMFATEKELAQVALEQAAELQAALGGVVREVLDERARQDAKWGEQNHPDLSPEVAGYKLELVHEKMGVALAGDAKARVERLARLGELGYADIALEEFAEAIEAAALRDTKALRTELIQTAAVLVAWVECIDRRTAKAEGRP